MPPEAKAGRTGCVPPFQTIGIRYDLLPFAMMSSLGPFLSSWCSRPFEMGVQRIAGSNHNHDNPVARPWREKELRMHNSGSTATRLGPRILEASQPVAPADRMADMHSLTVEAVKRRASVVCVG
jgi:hypothetical protein